MNGEAKGSKDWDKGILILVLFQWKAKVWERKQSLIRKQEEARQYKDLEIKGRKVFKEEAIN